MSAYLGCVASKQQQAGTAVQTPLTLLKRLRKDGLKGAREALSKWKPWIPTKQGQVSAALQQCVHTCACVCTHAHVSLIMAAPSSGP